MPFIRFSFQNKFSQNRSWHHKKSYKNCHFYLHDAVMKQGHNATHLLVLPVHAPFCDEAVVESIGMYVEAGHVPYSTERSI